MDVSELYIDLEKEKTPEVIKVTLDTHCAEKFDRDNQEIIEKVQEWAKKALKEAEEFYGTTVTKDIEIVITDREGLNKERGSETQDWVVGSGSENGAFILDPRLHKGKAEEYHVPNETNHTYNEEEIFQLIKHEIGHVIFNRISGISTIRKELLNPSYIDWFSEGTQQYMAGQKIGNVSTFNADFILDQNAENYYQNASLVVSKLKQKYGEEYREKMLVILNNQKNTFLNLDKNIKREEAREVLTKAFNDSFKDYFGFEPTQKDLIDFVNS